MKTKTSEANNNESISDALMAFISYALNKFMPLLLVVFVSFYSIGYATWEPYVIVGLMVFSNHFNFKCGYIHSELDRTNWKEIND